jgi:AraC family transcriptional regulator
VKESTRVDYQERMQVALRWLADNQRQEVSPAAVAKAVALSPYHFHRVFRGTTGESVMQCVRRLRLEAAARRLRHSDITILDAALDAAYASHEAFTRAFKEHFGEPPELWRKHQREQLRQKANSLPTDIEVELRNSPEIAFIYAAHRSSYAEVAMAWQEFITAAISAGIYDGTQQLVGRYPDDPEITPPGKVRFDVGFIATMPPMSLPSGFHFDLLPSGRWAIAVHAGSYATLHETYLKLVGGFIAQNGYALDDRPCLEFYRNTPATTAEPDLRTEVWAPLA